jgi:acyl CoA:acetate/3-ketoacid CoA transferase
MMKTMDKMNCFEKAVVDRNGEVMVGCPRILLPHLARKFVYTDRPRRLPCT